MTIVTSKIYRAQERSRGFVRWPRALAQWPSRSHSPSLGLSWSRDVGCRGPVSLCKVSSPLPLLASCLTWSHPAVSRQLSLQAGRLSAVLPAGYPDKIEPAQLLAPGPEADFVPSLPHTACVTSDMLTHTSLRPFIPTL